MTHGGNHRIFWAAQGLWVYPAGGTPSVSNFMRNVQAIGVDYGADATSIFEVSTNMLLSFNLSTFGNNLFPKNKSDAFSLAGLSFAAIG